MMSMRRLIACVAALAALSGSSFAQDLEATFNEAVELLRRGQSEEALVKLKACLAMDPGHDAAYQLFQSTEHEVWLDLLSAGGDTELVAKRLLELARIGRNERRDDPEAIRALVADVNSDDVGKRVQAIHTLAANHGEYAVPYLLHALADPDEEDRRVMHMQALVRMGSDVVLPLIAALESPSAFQRRNVALTLGYIGDPRAAGWLALVAERDEDAGARDAAAEALAKSGRSGPAARLLVATGNAWHAAAPDVLMPHQISEVIWRWEGTTVVATPIPPFLYNEELAKTAFYAALRADPASTEALAGIARASVAQRGELESRAAAGEDVGDWADRLAADDLAVQVAGASALDLALLWALELGDEVAASGLCRALGAAAGAPTQGLRAAIAGRTSGAVSGEAAIALGQIAVRTSTPVDEAVVAALAEAAGRQVVQLVGVIDADDGRRATLTRTLEERGLSVHDWPTGARGLASLRRAPGLDLLIVAESLPDLTFAQVVDEVRANPATASTPVLILAQDPAAATELWGERIAGAIATPEDIAKVDEALAGGLNRDREEANRLAARAGQTLADLAKAGNSNLAGATAALTSTLESRPDEVTVPAMHALAATGGPSEIPALAAVLANAERSDAAREAAGLALAGIFGRNPEAADESTLAALNDVATSEASFGVRRATATALGRLNLSSDLRADLVRSVRANLGGK